MKVKVKAIVARLLVAYLILFFTSLVGLLPMSGITVYAESLGDDKKLLLEALYKQAESGGAIEITGETVYDADSGITYEEKYKDANGLSSFDGAMSSLATNPQSVLGYLVKYAYGDDPTGNNIDHYIKMYTTIVEDANEDAFTTRFNEYKVNQADSNRDIGDVKDDVNKMFGLKHMKINEEAASAILSPFLAVLNILISVCLQIWGYFLIFQSIIDYIYITLAISRPFFEMFSVGSKATSGGYGGGGYGGGVDQSAKKSFGFSIISSEARKVVAKEEGGGGGFSSHGQQGSDSVGGGNPVLEYTVKRIPALAIAGAIMILFVGQFWGNILTALGGLITRAVNAFIG